MILKGSQRSGGQNLAAHLLRTDENEHVRIHEIRGFAADDLKGAFQEAEAISRATRCRQYLFSLSLSPPEGARVPVETFERTIARIEGSLGLERQPRAIVFHEKEGRRHAHCVWSRIDPETMTARPMSFYKTRLTGLSRELYLEHGWSMPRGLIDSAARNPLNFSLAEWQQAKRLGSDPRWLKAIVQDCWKRADNGASFSRALDERCLILAKGDRRGAVVIDYHGGVHALARMLDVRANDVRVRLGDIERLPSVADGKQTVSSRMEPAVRMQIDIARKVYALKAADLLARKRAMSESHQAARTKLERAQDAEWIRETRARAERLPKGLRGLWHRITGHYQKVRALNEGEAAATKTKHAEQRQGLIDKQLTERERLQVEVKAVRQKQAERLAGLRTDLSPYRREGLHRSRGLER